MWKVAQVLHEWALTYSVAAVIVHFAYMRDIELSRYDCLDKKQSFPARTFLLSLMIILSPVLIITEFTLNKVVFRFRHVIPLMFLHCLYPILLIIFEVLRGSPVYIIRDISCKDEDDDIVTFSYKNALFWVANVVFFFLSVVIYLIGASLSKIKRGT